MSGSRPSKVALAVFDSFIPDNDPLRGDLIERFNERPSQAWLWGQVLWAVACRPPLHRLGHVPQLHVVLLAAAILVLMAFEAVFVTNVIHRFLFGPPLQDIRGLLYLVPPLFHPVPAGAAQPEAPWTIVVPVLAVIASLPIGWFAAECHQRHRGLSLAVFTVSITVCAAVNIGTPLHVQLLTTMVFIVGMLGAGTIAMAADAASGAPA